MLVFVSLQSAIFWGQYSRCESDSGRRLLRQISNSITMTTQYEDTERRMLSYGVECAHTSAMKSVCTFSVMMFLSYVVLVAVMIKFKNDILGPAPLDEGYTSVSSFPGPNTPPIPPQSSSSNNMSAYKPQ